MKLSNTINAVALGTISAVFTIESALEAFVGKPANSVLSGSIAALAGNAAKDQYDKAVAQPAAEAEA